MFIGIKQKNKRKCLIASDSAQYKIRKCSHLSQRGDRLDRCTFMHALWLCQAKQLVPTAVMFPINMTSEILGLSVSIRSIL